MNKILYIGKSNKNFTHDNLYYYKASWSKVKLIEKILTICLTEPSIEDVKNFNVSIYSKKNHLVTIRDIYYFMDNFIFLNEIELIKNERKAKLKKLISRNNL